jgi:hypothetical protein
MSAALGEAGSIDKLARRRDGDGVRKTGTPWRLFVVLIH